MTGHPLPLAYRDIRAEAERAQVPGVTCETVEDWLAAMDDEYLAAITEAHPDG